MENREVEPTGSVSLVVRDEPSSVAKVRAAVEAVAAEHGLPPQSVFDLKLAATEALANALRRAPSEPVGVDVTHASDSDVIQVEVMDRGRFRIDEEGLGPERGRGLPLMVALADEVEFASDDEGTRVRIRMRIDRNSSPRAR